MNPDSYFKNPASGFEAIAFTNGTNLVISFAGTDFSDGLLSLFESDFWNGNYTTISGISINGADQLVDAVEYYLQVKASVPAGTTITLTGHSLGGALASLVGVFFGVPATTFDQVPAWLTAFPGPAKMLRDALIARGHTTEELVGLDSYIQQQGILNPVPNQDLITNLYVNGEVTRWLPALNIGTSSGISNNSSGLFSGVSSSDLHSMALLTAFLQSGDTSTSTSANHTLGQVTFKLQDLLKMIFDKNLFASDPLSKVAPVKENFLERIVKHQAGIWDAVTGTTAILTPDQMVTRFTSDLWKLAQDGGMTMNDSSGPYTIMHNLSKALTAFAMQMYYEDTANATDANKQLFTQITGGLRFDMADVSKTFAAAVTAHTRFNLNDAKGYTYFQNYINATGGFTPAEQSLIQSYLPYMRDWYVQAGTSGMTATDTRNNGAFMLGGNGQDILTGGTAGDLLVGNAGDDILSGGQGSDILIGGSGVDTYVWQAGPNAGIDIIIDKDNTGYLRDDTGAPIVITGGDQYGDNRVFRGTDANGTSHLYTYVTGNSATGGDLLVDGAMLIKNYNPNTGNHMGITMAGPVADASLTTLTGNDQDNFIGNDIYNRDPANPGKIILASGGQSSISILYSNSSATANILEGGLGVDILNGGAGDDRLYGNVQISAADAIAQGNAQTGSGIRGDWLNGGSGDDTLVGSNANDVLMGGGGKDLLIGGAGDDDIVGDFDVVAQSFTWTATIQPDGSLLFYPADGIQLPADAGADVIYAGGGIDRVWGGKGNDVIFGEGGGDSLNGDEGNDILLGGADSDKIWGGTGDDYLDGGAGVDYLYDEGGNDIIIGGTGNDFLYGGAGNDIYIYNRGDGVDHFYDVKGEGNILRFSEGIGSNDIVLRLGSLLLDLGNGDAIHIDNYDLATNKVVSFDRNDVFNSSSIAGFEFADGTTLSTTELLARGFDIIAKQGSVWTFGTNTTDRIYGLDTQADELYGNNGDDTLYGGAWGDTLYGGNGNDTLVGGLNSDFLVGNAGDDTYLISKDDGADTISNSSAENNYAGFDQIVFGPGILASQVTASRSGNWVTLTVDGNTASISYDAQNVQGALLVDQVAFTDDATVWSAADITAMLNSAPTGGVTVDGTAIQNQTLTAANTLTDANGLGPIAYQWQSSSDGITWFDITGATVDNFSLTEAQVGQQVRVNASYTDGHGAMESVNSVATAEVANVNDAPTGTVTLSGTATQNQILTAANTLADADGLGAIAYQWQSSIDGFTWTDIAGAMADSISLIEAQVGQQVRVNAGYTDGHGTVESVYSVATAAVANVNDAPTGAVTLSGYASQNQILTAANTLADADGLGNIAYQWQSSGDGSTWSNISGATADTFNLTVAQVGQQVRVNASYTDGHGTLESVNSVATAVVIDGLYIVGTDAADTLSGTGLDDVIIGLAGDDYLRGWEGNDTLDGGAGNDQMYGWSGSDTYLFGRGSGQDYIYEWVSEPGDWDVLQLSAGVSSSDVSVRMNWESVYLTINGTNDEVLIQFGLKDNEIFKIDEIRFLEDGTVWTWDQMKYMALHAQATDGKDGLMGDAISNTIRGLGGDDWITGNGIWTGGGGNDLLYGGDGADEIYVDAYYYGTSDTASDLVDGGAGDDYIESSVANDLIIGGTGADYISDSGGHDVMLFNRGDGQDGASIWSTDAVPVAQRTVSLGGGIAYADMAFSRNGDALVLDIGNGDSMTFDWWFNTSWGNNKLVNTLQIIAETIPGYTPNATDPLLSNRVQQFDFLQLANQFEAALAADPTITSWQLAPHLIEAGNYLGGSDTQALGGDMAYQYGVHGSTSGMTEAQIRAQLADASFGIAGQAITVAAINGTPSDDILTGTPNADQMYGMAGNDTLTGLASNDLLVGGTGNDVMSGGLGDDTYIINTGDGVDTIIDNFTGTENNTIVFGAGVDPASIKLFQGSLGLDLGNGTVVHIQGVDYNDIANTSSIQSFRFADGTVLSAQQLVARGFDITGSSGNDTLSGTNVSDRMNGGAGDDVLSGGGGDDVLDGGTGNDTLTGGSGNDTLFGGEGNDTYVYNLGDGTDTILDGAISPAGAEVNTLVLGAGITAAMITPVVSATGEVTLFFGNGDSISINRVGDLSIQNIQFADGSVIATESLLNATPVAVADAVSTSEDSAQSSIAIASLLANDTDPNAGDTLSMIGFDAISAQGNTVTQDANGNLIFDIGNRYQSLGVGQTATDTFSYTISDIAGATSTATVSMTITGLNDGPIANNDSAAIDENTAQTILSAASLLANDTDLDAGDVLSISGFETVSTQGNAISMDASGNLVFDIGNRYQYLAQGQTVTDTFNYTITDTAGATSTAQVTMTIAGNNDAPVVASALSNLNTLEDQAFSFTVPAGTFTDIDQGDQLTYRATLANGIPLPTWLTFDAVTQTFSGTPGNGDVASLNVVVSATDSGGLSASGIVALNVINVNDAPIAAMAMLSHSATQGRVISFSLPANSFTDIDAAYGDTLTFSAKQANGSALPAWLTFNAATHVFSGTPSVGDLANLSIMVTAIDSGGLYANSSFGLAVNAPVFIDTSGNDTSGNVTTLTGTIYDDSIYGLAGNDTLIGLEGNDLLDGGTGVDSLYGGQGNDIYIVDNYRDVVIENANEGTDTVQSSITYNLEAGYSSAVNVENLMLTGTSAINGTGNTLNNVLTGNNANNVLDGGAGADTMRGGLGNDTYYVDDAGDVVIELANEGIDTVVSRRNVDLILSAEIENGVLQSGGWAVNASGNGLDNVLDGSQNWAVNTLTGGLGNDTYNVGTGDIVVEAFGEGTDTVQSSITNTLGANVENLTLTGTSAINGTGNSLNNMLTGNSANNVMDGGTGADTMLGGLGDDTYVVDNTGDMVTENANEGMDTMQSSATCTLSANVEYLMLTGTSAINGTGNALDNILAGNSAVNTLSGGDGNDTYIVGTGDIVVEAAGAGTDTVQSAITYTLTANVENLALTGTSAINGTGNALDNVLTGNSGNNTLTGGAGNDTYIVGTGDTVVEAVGAGTDTVQSAITYTLAANVENLTLTGTSAINGTGNTLSNVLTGNSGNNVLNGGTGADTMLGGLGNDTYVVDNTGDIVTENLNEGTDTVQSAITYTLAANVENLTLTGSTAINGTGNALDNILSGNSAVNTLSGGDGNDTYIVSTGDIAVEAVGAGIDTVQSAITHTLAANVENLTLTGSSSINGTGNALDNVLTGNSGNNTLTGGAGNDTYIVGTGDTVVEAVGAGTDTVQSSVTYTLGTNVENLTLTGTTAINGTGNTLENVLDGSLNTAVNTLSGGAGNDTYIVGTGDTVVEAAGAGTDSVQSSITYTLAANIENLTLTGTFAINGTGNTLNNVLTGNSGNNVLNGGTGADTMLGGLGNDTYVVDNAGDMVTENANEGTDTVQSSVTYTLSDNVENITLSGTAAINGIGNTLDNVLDGSLNTAVNTLTGGTGNDTYILGTGDIVVEATGEGIDTVQSTITYTLGTNIENLTLIGTSAINGTGDTLDNVLDGSFNTAVNTLTGGAGNDTYIVGIGDIVVEAAGEGADTVQSAITYTLGANVENLTLTGSSAIIGTGNALDNILVGRFNTAATTLAGGLGNDSYYIDNDSVVEYAGEGIDTILTYFGNYSLAANVENLTLLGTTAIYGYGNVLDNTITGNDADNWLDGGAGADTLIGGAGNDVYRSVESWDVIIETSTLATEIDTVWSSGSYTLGANLEILYLGDSSAGCIGIGNELNNVISVLGRGTGAPTFPYNDVMDGGAGADIMSAGGGDDIYYVDNAGDVVVELAFDGVDTIYKSGIDTIYSSVSYTLAENVEYMILTGTDAIDGADNALSNLLIGNAASNMLAAGTGNDLLQGVDGNDILIDTAGANLLDGGTGDDSLTGNTGNELFIGGAGNDTITTGTGADIIAFNRGDGQDIVVASSGADNSLTLGGGIGYQSLAMSKSGNNLVLDTGNGDQITLQDWFAGTANRSVVNLQIVLDNMTYNPASTDALVNQQVQRFDFAALANDFDQVLAANPTLTAWNMTDALLTTHLSGSDTEALGGDLAYQYNLNNSLAGIGVASAQAVLGDANFGVAPQLLQPLASLQTGAARLS